MPATPPDPGGPRPASRSARAAAVPWALLPLLLPGIGAPLAFGIAAGRRPGAVTVAPLIIYTAAVVGFFALLLPFELGETPGWAYASAFAALVAATVAASAHAFAILGHVWAPREAPAPPQPRARPVPNGDWVAPALDRELRLREDARRLAEADPSLARRNGVGRPDQPRRLDDGGLVDLNHAPVDVLRHLPGFTEAAAKQVRERVERLGPFQNLDEVILEVDVAPGFEKHLREYAVLIP